MTDREKLVELLERIRYSQDFSCYDLYDMSDAAEPIADFLISNGVTIQEPIRKAEDCRCYTKTSYGGACLGTKEIDPCKGDKCESWKPKEE